MRLILKENLESSAIDLVPVQLLVQDDLSSSVLWWGPLAFDISCTNPHLFQFIEHVLVIWNILLKLKSYLMTFCLFKKVADLSYQTVCYKPSQVIPYSLMRFFFVSFSVIFHVFSYSCLQNSDPRFSTL